MKKSTWYENWFGKEYLEVYAHRDEEEARKLIDLIERVLHPAPESEILDLACGNGRHAIALAKRGYQVAGLDLSQDQIDEALRNAGAAGLKINFFIADMREVPCKRCYDGVVNFFTSFGYFETDEENQLVLTAIHAALKPGGWFVIDFLNPVFVTENLVPRSEDVVEKTTVIQERWISEGPAPRVNKKITLIQDGAPRQFMESVRLYDQKTMNGMIQKAGLVVTRTFGDYEGSEFNDDAPRMIFVGERRA